MTKTLMLAVALLVSTAWLTAQAQDPQTGSKHAGNTTSVRGCLQGSDGTYTLTSDSGTRYQLQGDTSKLSKHVGHEVEITGSRAANTTSNSAMSPTGENGESQRTLMVDSLKHISTTCSKASK